MTEVYGEANIELTPAYLILAEAAIGKHLKFNIEHD